MTDGNAGLLLLAPPPATATPTASPTSLAPTPVPTPVPAPIFLPVLSRGSIAGELAFDHR